jgi:hypothetical protein
MVPSPGYHPRHVLVQLRIFAALAAILLTGCAHNNAINFATSTQFGVKVGVNAEKIPEVQVGYNRQEAARVPVYLEQEKGAAGKTSNPGDASANAVLRAAQTFLNDSRTKDAAVAAIKSLEGTLDKSLKTNSIYKSLFDEAKGTNARVGLLNIYIQAALDLPTEIQRFHEQGKFIGTREGEKSADAYSVLGTFSGAGAGSLITNSAQLRISQFFATGIAAQELARAGGAATVNPNAKSPEALSVDERAKEREFGRQIAEGSAALDEVANKIYSAPPPAGDELKAQRKNTASRALKDCTLPIVNGKQSTLEEEAKRFSEMTALAAVRNRLRNHYRGQGQRMLDNLQEP